ncbi:MAG: DMT family transporter [Bacteroidota bacterium]
MQNGKFIHYAHLHFLVFIAGFTAILGKLITIDALPLVWYRMGLATLLIYLFVRIRKINLRFSKRAIAMFFGVGMVIAIHWVTFFWAIKVSNVSITLAVFSSGAFFASFLEPLFYKRRVFAYEVFFGILAIVGLYVIFEIETQYLAGIILALVSAFCSSLFSVLNGRLRIQYNPVAITYYEMISGTLFLSIVLLLNGDVTAGFFSIPATDWLYLFILASACTAYAFIAGIHLMKWISPYTMVLSYNLEPVYGIVLALLIFKDSEKMSPQFYYGALIILLTVVANGLVKAYLQRKNNRTSAD